MRASSLLPMLVVLIARAVFGEDGLDESNTIEKMELLGGKVARDDKLPCGPVMGVDLESSKRFSDGYLHLLKGFEHLTNLNLRNTRITDEGAVEIGKLTHLSKLSVADTAITDEGLKAIRQLESLTSLNLSNTRITDIGLMELSQLKTLNTLVLSGTEITDAGETELRKSLPNLRIRRNTSPAIQQIKELGKRTVRSMHLIAK